ncbi:uncharacterized protein LOC144576500 isoform X2 [Callithrix jacchus]
MMKLLEEQQKNEGFLKSERTSSAQQPWCWYRSYRQEKAKIMAAALRQPLLLAATHPRRACCEHLSSLGLCFLRRWLREYHRFLLAPRVQDFTADESGNVGAKGSCLPFPSHIPTVKNRSWPVCAPCLLNERTFVNDKLAEGKISQATTIRQRSGGRQRLRLTPSVPWREPYTSVRMQPGS